MPGVKARDVRRRKMCIRDSFESGIFETGFDLWDESDFEIVVSFDSPRERDGALPLTDIAIASLALTGLLESIVKAHQPFGLTLEMPVVLVFSGSYDAKTKKCPRAVSICMWVLLTVIPAIEPVVHATKWVVQTSTYVLTNRTDKQPLQKQSMLPDAQTRAVEADAALKAAQANLVEAQTKLVEAQTKGAEADAALKIAQANLIEAQTKLVEAQTKGAKADAASKEAQARLVEAEARAIEEGVKLNEAHAKFADAQSRIVEAQAAVRNAQVRPAETETTEAATTGDAAGDARIINEHPVSFYVSADKINEQAQYLGVEPAYICLLYTSSVLSTEPPLPWRMWYLVEALLNYRTAGFDLKYSDYINGRITSVSYTHLDVYKRQGWRRERARLDHLLLWGRRACQVESARRECSQSGHHMR